MIEGYHGDYTLECDICGAEAEETFDSFMDAVEWKKDKSNGWTSKKRDGEWMDVCPDCRES